MNNFLKIGKQKEKEFAQILIDNFGGTITYPICLITLICTEII